MKDATAKVCVGMVMGTLAYAAYMVSNAIAGNDIPDGTLFTAMLAFIGTLSGVSIALPRMKRGSA